MRSRMCYKRCGRRGTAIFKTKPICQKCWGRRFNKPTDETWMDKIWQKYS